MKVPYEVVKHYEVIKKVPYEVKYPVDKPYDVKVEVPKPYEVIKHETYTVEKKVISNTSNCNGKKCLQIKSMFLGSI